MTTRLPLVRSRRAEQAPGEALSRARQAWLDACEYKRYCADGSKPEGCPHCDTDEAQAWAELVRISLEVPEEEYE